MRVFVKVEAIHQMKSSQVPSNFRRHRGGTSVVTCLWHHREVLLVAWRQRAGRHWSIGYLTHPFLGRYFAKHMGKISKSQHRRCKTKGCNNLVEHVQHLVHHVFFQGLQHLVLYIWHKIWFQKTMEGLELWHHHGGPLAWRSTAVLRITSFRRTWVGQKNSLVGQRVVT